MIMIPPNTLTHGKADVFIEVGMGTQAWLATESILISIVSNTSNAKNNTWRTCTYILEGQLVRRIVHLDERVTLKQTRA